VGETNSAMRGELVEVVEPKGVAPKFSKLLTDILAPEGNKVTFECCVNGDPKPNIKWYLNNEEIHHSNHIQVNTNQLYVCACGYVGVANVENEVGRTCDMGRGKKGFGGVA
jgi:Immunoglobulin I-set domain.